MEADEEAGASKRQVPAVTRAIAILRLLGRASEPVGVQKIARDLGLVPSTCLHILRVLVDEGVVAFDPVAKRYTIDVGILPIARNAIQRNGFVQIVQPHLTQLSTDFGVSAIATRLATPDHMVVVALSQADMPFRLQVDLGSSFPALISATGRCIAAFGSAKPVQLKAQFSRLNWANPPSFDEWMAQVEETRRTGIGVDKGHYISGVTIYAVPVFNAAKALAYSIVTVGISEQLEAASGEEMARRMLEVRDAVAEHMVQSSSFPPERRGR
ncbi:MAG: IclR family transcriptional regulator [Magnetospirillum sp.]